MSMEFFRPLENNSDYFQQGYGCQSFDIEKNLPIYLKMRFLDVQRFRNAKLKDMYVLACE